MRAGHAFPSEAKDILNRVEHSKVEVVFGHVVSEIRPQPQPQEQDSKAA